LKTNSVPRAQTVNKIQTGVASSHLPLAYPVHYQTEYWYSLMRNLA